MNDEPLAARPDHARNTQLQELRTSHANTLWVHFGNILLGCWLITAPAILGYSDSDFAQRVFDITQERGLADPMLRAHWLMWSDMLSGALLVLFGGLSLVWRHRWAQWASCLVGLWLISAPLLFWAPSALIYANDTLVGALAITFAVLIPTPPGISIAALQAKDDIPPGWDYSPSSWSQRLPIIVLAFVGFFIARYLSAYQLGHIEAVWDPFFGDGTVRIITSEVSHAWPVADAGLGAVTYLIEALSGMLGSSRRWRTMPWMVGLFGVLVIPLGGVSIFFIVIQPIVIGTWCTLCLISAAAMVIMLPYSFDEIVAMGQFVLRARREGQGLWRVFWRGGTTSGGRVAGGPPLQIGSSGGERFAQARALPKGLIVCALLGVWLMFTRLTFGTTGAMADSDHLIGAMLVTFSIAALSEVFRPLRAINFLFAGWLLLAPWLLDGGNLASTLNSMVVGVLVIVLTLPRGPVRDRYGSWDRFITW
jgi:hypothetical protein